MRSVVSYYYDDSKFRELLKEKFPSSAFEGVSIDEYSEDKVNEMMETLNEVLLNPKSKMMELPERTRENITCLPEKVREQIMSLFDDEDLILFGHGGNAKEILETGKMYCCYKYIPSHFLPLTQTNESLDNLNHWPHKDAHQILIMGINQREFNPLFKREENGYYSIPSEYFLGYYDRDLEEFIPNPEFKRRHEYKDEDPSIELHTGDYINDHSATSKQENFNRILHDFDNIRLLLSISSYSPLDKKGIEDVSKQVSYFTRDTYNEVKKLTPEVISNFKQSMANNNASSNNHFDDLGDFDTELGDFDFDAELGAMFSTDSKQSVVDTNNTKK